MSTATGLMTTAEVVLHLVSQAHLHAAVGGAGAAGLNTLHDDLTQL